jgi:hypothetical protein
VISTSTRVFQKKVRAKTQHEAISKARKKIPKGYVLQVRTASQALKKGTWWVDGLLRERKKVSKIVK